MVGKLRRPQRNRLLPVLDASPRFAITATDRYLGVFSALVNVGWKPIRLFTTLTDNRIHSNKAVIEYAERLALPVQFSRLTEKDLEDLARQECDVLVVASYRWRIPEWRPYLKYAINFHPSPLPKGRGPYPAVPALLHRQTQWGVTCHKLTPDFDSGDILDTELFPVDDAECHERLDLKSQMAAQRLAERIARDLPTLWMQARAQTEATYHSHWTDDDRHIRFTDSVDDILRRIRAFGLIETMATVNEVSFYIRRAVGWKEPHAHAPGTMVFISGLSMVVAAGDGYIGIIEWSLIDPAASVGRIGRGPT